MTDNKDHHLEWEDYSTTSKLYDRTRRPVGIQNYISRLTELSNKSDTENNQLHFLDCGCGTGNYTVPLSPLVAKVTAFDFNAGMLETCKEKIDASQDTATPINNVTLCSGSLTEKLPYDDNTFDAAICNQVVHHIDLEAPFTNLRFAISELYRVVKPGGWVGFNYVAAAFLVGCNCDPRSTGKVVRAPRSC